MTKHLCILISPEGDEFYAAYGPMTKLRDRATRYESAAVARGTADHYFGRHDKAFWNSERTSRDRLAIEYRGWTSRTEEVADDDERREGHFVVDYPSGRPSTEGRYARIGSDGRAGWADDLADCSLWPERNAALAFTRSLPKQEGRNYAIDRY